jgi:hypothetical protein
VFGDVDCVQARRAIRSSVHLLRVSLISVYIETRYKFTLAGGKARRLMFVVVNFDRASSNVDTNHGNCSPQRNCQPGCKHFGLGELGDVLTCKPYGLIKLNHKPF